MDLYETFTSLELPRLNNAYQNLQHILRQTTSTPYLLLAKNSTPNISIEALRPVRIHNITSNTEHVAAPLRIKRKQNGSRTSSIMWERNVASMQLDNHKKSRPIKLNQIQMLPDVPRPSFRKQSISKMLKACPQIPPRQPQQESSNRKFSMLEQYLQRKEGMAIRKWHQGATVEEALQKYVEKVNRGNHTPVEMDDLAYVKTYDEFQQQQKKVTSEEAEYQEENRGSINLADVHFSSKKMETSPEEQLNEDRRNELMKQIQMGQQQMSNQHQMMLNKNYRMLVQEGKQRSKKRKAELDYKVVRTQLISNLQFLKRLKLTPKILMNTEVFSYKPFQKPGSQALIQACKMNNHQIVQEILKDNRFLVYDFDFIQLTALHWACKRGHVECAKLLIDAGADVEAQDLISRTPLYFAIEANSHSLVKLLLENAASPWSTPTANYSEIGKSNRTIMKMLNKSRKLHILMRMTPPAIRDEIWKQQVKSNLRI